MAAQHVKCDPTKEIPRSAQRYLKMMQEAGDGLRRVLDSMAEASDGDRDAAEDFDLLATLGGYQAGDYGDANAAAKKSFDELNAVVGNYEAATRAAVNQTIAIHGWP